MPFSPDKFVNAGQFGDYSSYSGMGGDQQMKSVKEVLAQTMGMGNLVGPQPDQVSGAVAPPQSFSEAATAIGNNMSSGVDNFTNRFQQASQGNIYNAVTGKKPVAPTQQAQQVPQPFSYQSAVDQIDRD